MFALKRAPSYTLLDDFEADKVLANCTEGDAINCNGYEYLNIQVLPAGGADVTLTVGVWSDEGEAAIALSPNQEFTGTTAFEASINARGRKICLGVALGGAGSAKVLVSGFNWVNPD